MSLHILFPNYKNYSGHENSFVHVYDRLARNINRQIFFYVAEDNSINFKNKIKYFKNVNDKNIIQKINYIFVNSVRLFSILNKDENNKRTFLIDGQSTTFIISIILSCLFLNSKKKKFIIFYREAFFLKIFQKLLYSVFFFFIKIKFEDLIILTDTIQLKKKIIQKHNVQVYLLPIPHTFKNLVNKVKYNKKIRILLPGQYRKEKGEKKIINFINNNLNENFIIKLGKNFSVKESKKITWIPNNLSLKQYKKVLKSVDMIFLPYDNLKYFYSSSGIFIEAISLNKICFVSSNTWMSKILKANKLHSLVISKWEKLKISKIRFIINDKKILSNFNKLKKKIVKKNNPEIFIDKMKKII